MSKAHELQTLEGKIDKPERRAPKVFAKPFRLVFKRTEDMAVAWIEVKSLAGLRTVCEKIANGDLVPVDAYSTLDRQLWGHLAEHVGFLRYAGPEDEFSAGIQPAGPGFGELADDLTTLFGGTDGMLQGLAELREQIMRDVEARMPYEETTNHDFVKEDGVNLTPEGEQKLAELAGESGMDVVGHHLESLVRETDPTPDLPAGATYPADESADENEEEAES